MKRKKSGLIRPLLGFAVLVCILSIPPCSGFSQSSGEATFNQLLTYDQFIGWTQAMAQNAASSCQKQSKETIYDVVGKHLTQDVGDVFFQFARETIYLPFTIPGCAPDDVDNHPLFCLQPGEALGANGVNGQWSTVLGYALTGKLHGSFKDPDKSGNLVPTERDFPFLEWVFPVYYALAFENAFLGKASPSQRVQEIQPELPKLAAGGALFGYDDCAPQEDQNHVYSLTIPSNEEQTLIQFVYSLTERGAVLKNLQSLSQQTVQPMAGSPDFRVGEPAQALKGALDWLTTTDNGKLFTSFFFKGNLRGFKVNPPATLVLKDYLTTALRLSTPQDPNIVGSLASLYTQDYIFERFFYTFSQEIDNNDFFDPENPQAMQKADAEVQKFASLDTLRSFLSAVLGQVKATGGPKVVLDTLSYMLNDPTGQASLKAILKRYAAQNAPMDAGTFTQTFGDSGKLALILCYKSAFVALEAYAQFGDNFLLNVSPLEPMDNAVVKRVAELVSYEASTDLASGGDTATSWSNNSCTAKDDSGK